MLEVNTELQTTDSKVKACQKINRSPRCSLKQGGRKNSDSIMLIPAKEKYKHPHHQNPSQIVALGLGDSGSAA